MSNRLLEDAERDLAKAMVLVDNAFEQVRMAAELEAQKCKDAAHAIKAHEKLETKMNKLIGKKAQVDLAVENARAEYQQAQRAALQEMKKCSVALAALAKASNEQERQHGF